MTLVNPSPRPVPLTTISVPSSEALPGAIHLNPGDVIEVEGRHFTVLCVEHGNGSFPPVLRVEALVTHITIKVVVK